MGKFASSKYRIEITRRAVFRSIYFLEFQEEAYPRARGERTLEKIFPDFYLKFAYRTRYVTDVTLE